MSGPSPKIHERYSFSVKFMVKENGGSYVAKCREFPMLTGWSDLGLAEAIWSLEERIREEIERRILEGHSIPMPDEEAP